MVWPPNTFFSGSNKKYLSPLKNVWSIQPWLLDVYKYFWACYKLGSISTYLLELDVWSWNFLFRLLELNIKMFKFLYQCFERLRFLKSVSDSQNLFDGARAVLLETLYQNRSRAKHWFKNLNILGTALFRLESLVTKILFQESPKNSTSVFHFIVWYHVWCFSLLTTIFTLGSRLPAAKGTYPVLLKRSHFSRQISHKK